MIIFESEAKIEGLADKIMANLSVSYNSLLKPWAPSERESFQKESLSKSLAAHKDYQKISKASLNDSDLYFTKSILVSTNWNKNDDVFSPYETWAARHTPSHKPTNIEHDETRMVGHITETWALDNDGVLIPDNTIAEDLPSLYHIANGAVIYTNWQDDSLIERTESLIASIQEGKKYVSMEAIFTNFAYAIVTPEEQRHVVARNQDTAFLTKHLRCYGGTGEFEGCKLGRILKNITFSGKGYVDQPANPLSIIFQDDGNVFNYTAASTENPFSKESGVSFSCSSSSKKNSEKSSMSDNTQSVDLLKTQNEDYKQAVASLQAKVDELTKASSEAGIKTLKSEIETLSAKLEATEKERDEAVASVETLTSEKDTISTQLTEATEAKETLEKEVAEAKEAQVKANRISHLVDGGVEKDVAEAKVETFANLNDEQFDSIAEDIISAKKMKDDEDKDKKKEEKSDASEDSSDDELSQDDAEASADESVLENAEAEEQPDLTAEASDNTVSEFDEQVSDLRSAIASRFGYSSDEEAESN